VIINVRGTSGSGKTTLARKIVKHYGAKTIFYKPGRKRPLGYVYRNLNTGKHLALLGHYETTCGGCDTLPTIDEVFGLVREAHDLGYDVLFEGLLISAEINRIVALKEQGYPVVVVALNTPLDVCLESINERRRARHEERLRQIEEFNAQQAEKGRKLRPLPEEKGEVNPRNTTAKHKCVVGSLPRLEAQGVRCYNVSRDEAEQVILDILRPHG